MMLRCTECYEEFQLEGEHAALSSDLNKGPVKCPMCLSLSVVPTCLKREGRVATELTAEQFWMAMNGFGLPDEIVTEPETVTAMLLAHEVVGVGAYKTISGRVAIDNVLLDNGVTLHFTASGEGAVIFKLTRTKETEDAS